MPWLGALNVGSASTAGGSMYFGSAYTQPVMRIPFDAVASIGTYSARSVGLLAVTVHVGPVRSLNVTSGDFVDHVMVGSVTRAGATVAENFAPGPPVRMAGGTGSAPKSPPLRGAPPPPLKAMRKGRLPWPAASYFAFTPAGSQSSGAAPGAARSRFHGLNAATSRSLSSRP